jgi:hypothetical protein
MRKGKVDGLSLFRIGWLIQLLMWLIIPVLDLVKSPHCYNWTVRVIMFLDITCVFFSNPICQRLFEYGDRLDGVNREQHAWSMEILSLPLRFVIFTLRVNSDQTYKIQISDKRDIMLHY